MNFTDITDVFREMMHYRAAEFYVVGHGKTFLVRARWEGEEIGERLILEVQEVEK